MKKALLGQVSDADVRLLRVFKAVVDSGGITAAELELNVGRSTISRHIKDLEDRLGMVLCRRGRAGFELTAEGRRVHDDAVRLLQAIDTFRSNVEQMHDALTGELQIGLFDKTVSNPKACIPAAVRRFRAEAPQVALQVTVGATNTLEQGVMDGRLQMAVVPEHRRSDSLDYLPLFDERMLLYCGRGHPLFGHGMGALSWDTIRHHDYAGLMFHSPNLELTHRLSLRRTASVTDQEAVVALVLSGCYIGFLPDHYAAGFEAQGLMQVVAHPQARYEVQFAAISRRAPTPSRACKAFLRALQQAHAAPAGPGNDAGDQPGTCTR